MFDRSLMRPMTASGGGFDSSSHQVFVAEPNLDELIRWRVAVENDRTVRAANTATEPALPTCVPPAS